MEFVKVLKAVSNYLDAYTQGYLLIALTFLEGPNEGLTTTSTPHNARNLTEDEMSITEAFRARVLSIHNQVARYDAIDAFIENGIVSLRMDESISSAIRDMRPLLSRYRNPEQPFPHMDLLYRFKHEYPKTRDHAKGGDRRREMIEYFKSR